MTGHIGHEAKDVPAQLRNEATPRRNSGAFVESHLQECRKCAAEFLAAFSRIAILPPLINLLMRKNHAAHASAVCAIKHQHAVVCLSCERTQKLERRRMYTRLLLAPPHANIDRSPLVIPLTFGNKHPQARAQFAQAPAGVSASARNKPKQSGTQIHLSGRPSPATKQRGLSNPDGIPAHRPALFDGTGDKTARPRFGDKFQSRRCCGLM